MCRQEFVKNEAEDEEPPQETTYIDNSYHIVSVPANVDNIERFVETQETMFPIPEREWRQPLCRKISKEFMRLHRMGNLRPRRKRNQFLNEILGIPCPQSEEGYRSS